MDLIHFSIQSPNISFSWHQLILTKNVNKKETVKNSKPLC